LGAFPESCYSFIKAKEINILAFLTLKSGLSLKYNIFPFSWVFTNLGPDLDEKKSQHKTRDLSVSVDISGRSAVF
jgi:hypothetical protein